MPEALALVLALLVLAGTLAAAVVHSRWPVEALAAAGGAALLVAVGTLSVSDARDAVGDLAPTVGFLAALLVAERLERTARLVGPENVLASTDCGFAQGPYIHRVHPTIQWAKLRSLSEGAELASRALSASR